MSDDTKCTPCSITVVLGQIEQLCKDEGKDPGECERRFEKIFREVFNGDTRELKAFFEEVESGARNNDEKAVAMALRQMLNEMKLL
tara:strand:+ start:11947 stop:12204 length:258 start_codon:yes stop_codon:yes gene_type:complete